MKGWQAVTPNGADGTHVVPTADITFHSLDESCMCGPSSELIETPHGDAWMHVHHSLDGREQQEADPI